MPEIETLVVNYSRHLKLYN